MAQKTEEKKTISPPIKEISFGKVKVEKELGHGNYYVYQAKLDDKMIAVKAMRLNKLNPPREVTIHEMLRPHERVLTPIGVAYNPDRFHFSYICMDLATKSLYQHLHDDKVKPSFEESTKWALQIAQGMQHLHTYDVAHRDLKPHNVLLFATGDIKLCDFGCARFLDHTAEQTHVMGTLRYIAPEIQECTKAKINKACDVFSYGMVLYELFEHQIPFHHIEDSPRVTTLIRDHKRPRIPSSLPKYLKHLMQACWEHNSHDRPEFQAIVRAQETKIFAHQIKTAQLSEPADETDDSFINPKSSSMSLQEAGVPHIDENSIKLGDLIRKEMSGSVYEGTWNEKTVAIKKIFLDEDHYLPRECILHAFIPHHPSVLAFFGVVVDIYEPKLVMEFSPKGSIFDYLYEQKEVPTIECSLTWALQVAQGMEHLHKHNIIHRDLKSANIHLSTLEVTKIGGFGVACRIDGDTTEQSDERGTYRWMAPEVMEAADAKITQKCDVFSYGMLLYEFFVHKQPYAKFRDAKAVTEILNGKRPSDIPSSLPEYIQHLIPACWAHDANERPTFNKVQCTLQNKHFEQL